MMRQRRSLKGRIVRSMVGVVVVSLVASGSALIMTKQRSLVRSMQGSARNFAALVALPLAAAVSDCRQTGDPALYRAVSRYARLNRHLVRVRVVDTAGRVLMDAEVQAGRVSLKTCPLSGSPPRRVPLDLRRLVGGDALHAATITVPGKGSFYRVVAPAVDAAGRHAYALVALFSYRQVNNELFRSGAVTAFFLICGLFLSYVVSVFLARPITQSVEELQRGVRRFSASRFDERVEVRSGDEIQDLAESFNAMADRLQASIRALEDAYARLESLDEAKRGLLASVSHELKTPLTALRGYLELLGDGRLGRLSEHGERAVQICRKNVDRLTRRIEELVELARLEREGVSVPVELIDLRSLVEGIVDTVWPRVEEKDLWCSLESTGDLAPVTGNAEYLERAFMNLIDNAIKFTPAGGSIRIRLENSEMDGLPGVLARVQDTGIGIPSEQLADVFERFYQVDQSSKRRFGGMGLGLALVKRAVELHRGRVWAESADGVGSTFLVWLPTAGGDGPRKGDGEPPGSGTVRQRGPEDGTEGQET